MVRAMSNARNIGGSLLPSGSPQVYAPKVGAHGTFETRPLAELDTHGLFYARATGEFAGRFILIASHPNGYTCDELARRIIAAWNGGPVERALQQFDFALDCGGTGKRRETIEQITRGEF